MRSRLRYPRLIGLLLGLSLISGVLAAGISYPVAAGLGLVAGDAGDSVTTVSTDVVDGPLPETTTVTDATGKPIARFFDPNQNRQAVTSQQISPAMKAAIVAIEDRRFYQHNGVDWQGTLRAVLANSASGDVVQGASTLTQQYVKNYFLYVEAKTETDRLKATEQTSARKLKEAQIALQMERSLSKDDILTRYLNIVSFGNGAAGIQSAARTYFNTTAAKLTVPQAAMLAGMVRSTTAFDPVTKPQAALERRNIVIAQMREQQMIDETQLNTALKTPLGVAKPLVGQSAGCIGAGDAGFFCKYVQSYLLEAGFSEDKLTRGGYTIKDHARPHRPAEDEGLARRRGAAGPAQRGRRDVGRAARADQAPRARDGVEPHVRAERRRPADQLRAALRAGQPGRGLGLQDLHLGHGPGEGPRHLLPARRAAQRLPLPDLRGRQRHPAPGQQRRQVRGAAVAAGRAGPVAEHRVHQAGGVHRRARRRRHGGPAGHEVAGHDAVRQPRHRTAHRPLHRRGHQGPEAGVVHARGDADERAGAVQRRGHAGEQRQVVPAQPHRVDHRPVRQGRAGDRGAVPAGGGARAGQHPADRPEQGRPARWHLGRGSPAGGLEPSDRGQDRDDPGAQVGRVRRGGPPDGRRGDHVRQLQPPQAALRRCRRPVRLRHRQHLRRQDPGRDVLRRHEADPRRPAHPAAAAHRPPLRRGRCRLPRPRRGGAQPERRSVGARGGELEGLDAQRVQRRRARHRGRAEPARLRIAGETIVLSISSGSVPPPPAAPGADNPPSDNGGDGNGNGDNNNGDNGNGDNGGGDNGDDN